MKSFIYLLLFLLFLIIEENSIAQQNSQSVLNVSECGVTYECTYDVIRSNAFYYARNFSEGLAAVQRDKDGEMGYINKKGRVVIPLVYDDAFPFSEGLGLVKKDGRYGFVDLEGEVIEPRYLRAGSFSEGLAVVKAENGDWGYINRNGDWVIEPQYDRAWGFSEGIAHVLITTDRRRRAEYKYINTKGEEVSGRQYERNSSEGFVHEYIWRGHDRYRIKSKYVKGGFTSREYNDVQFFSEGLAGVSWGRWGFINTEGEEVIPRRYDRVMPFSEGLAGVKKDGKWGFINTQGEEVIPFQFDEVRSFSEGRAFVVFEGHKKWSLIRIKRKSSFLSSWFE